MVFYIISGTGVLRTPDRERLVQAGDLILCPTAPEGARKLTNPSETEPLQHIDFDTTQGTDVISYPDSGKTVVIVHGRSAVFYPHGADTDYYDGEGEKGEASAF